MSDITKGKLRRTVIILALPAVARMFLQMLVGVVDLAMVGKISPAAISAVGMGNQVFFLSTAILNAFTVGTTALVARMIGAGKAEQAKVYARQSLVVTFAAGLILGVLVFFSAEHLMKFMMIAAEKPDPEIIRLGTMYLRIVALAEPLTFTMMNSYAILQGAGNMKAPLYIMGLANILNVIFDYLLIFGIGIFPKWGVAGAAIATAGSKNLAAIIALFFLFSRYSPIRLSLKDSFRPQVQRIQEIMDIGLPSAGEQLVRSSGQLVFSMLVASMGPIAIAANQIITKSTSMSFMPGIGFGHAATTMVGQNLGAKQPQRAERGGYMAAKMAAIFMSCVGLLFFFFFSHQLAGLFTSDAAVQQAAGECLKIMAISQPFLAYVMVLAGGLRGAGDTKYVLLVTFVGTWGSRVVIAWFLGVYLGFGLKGVWIAMVIDNLIRAAMMIARYRRGEWKSYRLRSEVEVA
jgi:putative MATE family efflux protein